MSPVLQEALGLVLSAVGILGLIFALCRLPEREERVSPGTLRRIRREGQ